LSVDEAVEITYCARGLGLRSRFDGAQNALGLSFAKHAIQKSGVLDMKKTALAIATFAALGGSAIAADKSLSAELR
jgi:hypothetical protein